MFEWIFCLNLDQGILGSQSNAYDAYFYFIAITLKYIWLAVHNVICCFRSDVAWKYANYAQIWEYLRDEYELTQRFGNLDFKLKFVEVKPCSSCGGSFIINMFLMFILYLQQKILKNLLFLCSTTFVFYKKFFKTGNQKLWNGLSLYW